MEELLGNIDPQIRGTIEVYNKEAFTYRQKSEGLTPPAEKAAFISMLKPNSLILDAGCGYGRDSRFFLDAGHRVIGIDLSRNLLKIAEEYVPAMEQELMDVRNLRFTDNFFDAIWCCAVLHHLPREDFQRALEGFKRVLKPGGILFLLMREGEDTESTKDELFPGLSRRFTYFTTQEVTGAVEKSGLKLLDCHIYNEDKALKTGRNVDYVACFARKPEALLDAAGISARKIAEKVKALV